MIGVSNDDQKYLVTYFKLMIKIRIGYLLICLCIAFSMYAQDNGSLLKSGASAFESKSFEEAIQQYERIIASGNHSVALYNNIGSTYYEKGDFPHAVLYFEKGLKLSPFNKSVIHNLSLAKEQLDNDIVEIPEFFLSRVWKYLYTRLSSNTWFILSLITMFGSVYAFSIWLLHSVRTRKKKGFMAGGVLLVLGVLMFFLSSSQAKFQYKNQTAIVLKSSIPLKSAPEEANEAIQVLEPGVKLFILDRIGDYDKVRLENGQEGWVLKGGYEAI